MRFLLLMYSLIRHKLRIPFGIKLSFLDFWKGLFKGTHYIQRQLRSHLREQNKNWPKKQRYTQGYFYQGLEELGITGSKPTGFRFRQYDVDEIIKNADVLDIGSNSGFVTAYCAKRAKSVTAVELNPYLNKIAIDTAKYLKLNNIDVVESDFTKYSTEKKFDVILTLSNHHTIDGNLNMWFESYIQKIISMLKPNGYMLFESHNVFAPGNGGLGDDGDMEEKFAIVNKYFNIERYRMVNCFLKHQVEDIDKLFIVARLSENPIKVQFSLPEAIKKYHY